MTHVGGRGPNLLLYGYPNHSSNSVIIYLLVYEDGTECSETSAYKIQTPGNYPEENIQHTEHGKSLKSRKISNFFSFLCLIITN
jgi:hypothetical protein